MAEVDLGKVVPDVTASDISYSNAQSGIAAANVQDAIDVLKDSLTAKSVDISITCSDATFETTNLKRVGNIVTGAILVVFKTSISSELNATVSGKDAPIQQATSYCYVTSTTMARAVINRNTFTFKNFGSSAYSSGWSVTIPFTWIV